MHEKPTQAYGTRYGVARVLSKQGLCSRSEAERRVRAGRVRVNGRCVLDPEFPVRMGIDRIELDTAAAAPVERWVVALNKPRGLVTSTRDEQQRATVYQCLPNELPWLAPVGRLDKASEGLLLFSNDPTWAARLLDPASELKKTYHVQIGGHIEPAQLQAMQAGLRDAIDCLRAARASLLRRGEKNDWLEIQLDEGRNRQIRRMLDGLGYPVLRLLRVAIGPLTLGDLAKGRWRRLSESEIAELSAAAQT